MCIDQESSKSRDNIKLPLVTIFRINRRFCTFRVRPLSNGVGVNFAGPAPSMCPVRGHLMLPDFSAGVASAVSPGERPRRTSENEIWEAARTMRNQLMNGVSCARAIKTPLQAVP